MSNALAFLGRDMAVDLGTANTLVYVRGRGIVLNEPSVIALNRQTGEVLATGREAWQMIGGRSGNVVALRPLRHGVMTEFDITQRMIEVVLRRVGVSRFPKPRVLACVASESSEVERRAVREAVRFAGGRDVVRRDERRAVEAAVCRVGEGGGRPGERRVDTAQVDPATGAHRRGRRPHRGSR